MPAVEDIPINRQATVGGSRWGDGGKRTESWAKERAGPKVSKVVGRVSPRLAA